MGLEYAANAVQNHLKSNSVKWYYTYSGTKAALVERQIRTLKETMARIFHHTGSRRYVDWLPKLADAYNHTVHSRTKIAPVNVNATNEQQVFTRLYGGPRKTTNQPKLRIGQQVRLSLVKGIFAKPSSERKWTEEIFKIKRVRITDPIMYYLEDESGEEILGGFYEYELNPVIKDAGDLFDIEKVLKKKKNKDGQMMYFVKWRGYDNTYNSWVSNIENKN